MALVFVYFSALGAFAEVDRFAVYETVDPSYVMVAAHRCGYMSNGVKTHPENSISAAQSSISLGADMLEIDVRLSSDGVPVLMHDSTVNRTTTGSGSVSSLTLAQLKALYLLGPDGQPSTERIPTLEEFMLETKDKVLVNLDKVDINSITLRDACMAVLIATDTVDQAIFKGGASRAQVDAMRAAYPGEIIHYMPLLSKTSESTMISTLDSHEPPSMELVFSSSSTPMLSAASIAKATETDTHIFINSLWGSICADHHDAVALGGDPDGSWGWLVDKGATIIQTDNAPQLISYLYSRGLRSNTPPLTVLESDFDDGTMQGWSNTVSGSSVLNPSHFASRLDQGKGGGHTPDYSLLHDGDGSWLDGRDVAHDTLVASSPPFSLSASALYSISFYLLGGTGDEFAEPASLSALADTTATDGFMGVALRRVSDGAYLLYDRRDTPGQSTAWEQQGWTPAEIAAATAGDASYETYQLDLIDQYHGSWGWIILDTVVLSETSRANWVGGYAAWENAASWDIGIAPGLKPLNFESVSIATGVASIGNMWISIVGGLEISGNGGVSKIGTAYSDVIGSGGLLDLQGGATYWESKRFYIKGTTSGGSGELSIGGGLNEFYSADYFSVGRESDGVGQLTVSGGDTTITSGIATIFGGFQGDGKVDMTGGILTIEGPLWVADQGNVTISHSGGDLFADDLIFGRSNASGATNSCYNLTGSASLTLSGSLIVGNGFQTPANNVFTVDGGSLSVAGISHVSGEFVFQAGELTIRDTDVSDTILGESWFIADEGTSVIFDGSNTVVSAAVKSATIIDCSYIPDNSLMRIVFNTPSSAGNYSPQATTNLVNASWSDVPHSDDGVNDFIITDLSYSTIEGSNRVVYVSVSDATKFFRLATESDL